jgi:hypothetical protein
MSEQMIENLNNPLREQRLAAAREVGAALKSGDLPKVDPGRDVNHHVHTTYSFSPYSPSCAVYKAYEAGLKTVGIVDHDSVSGAREFLEAADAIGILPTVGCECRVDMTATRLGMRRCNNPDQEGVAYVALHGIPHQMIDEVDKFFAPLRKYREDRDRKMTDRINTIMKSYSVALDYDRDVRPLSMAAEGGSVTERHLLFALAKKLMERFGMGQKLVDFLEKDMGETVPAKIRGYLLDGGNVNYAYDLLGFLKSGLISEVYIPASDECPPVADYIALAKRTGAIAAYAYLGDVGDSVTGDKKAQKFEDDWLPELFEMLDETGFDAVTYMPSRNTKEQLRRVRGLCKEHGLFQISGEDINSPRQSFVCLAQRDPEYADLYDSTFALIGSEQRATAAGSPDAAMFSEASKAQWPDLAARVKVFGQV